MLWKAEKQDFTISVSISSHLVNNVEKRHCRLKVFLNEEIDDSADRFIDIIILNARFLDLGEVFVAFRIATIV